MAGRGFRQTSQGMAIDVVCRCPIYENGWTMCEVTARHRTDGNWKMQSFFGFLALVGPLHAGDAYFFYARSVY